MTKGQPVTDEQIANRIGEIKEWLKNYVPWSDDDSKEAWADHTAMKDELSELQSRQRLRDSIKLDVFLNGAAHSDSGGK